TGDTDLGLKPLAELIDKSRAGKTSLMRADYKQWNYLSCSFSIHSPVAKVCYADVDANPYADPDLIVVKASGTKASSSCFECSP
ncbi:hypothetical protein KI387_023484, partial [Taxus chinensis]